MKIALSVDALSPELTGIGRYCWELASGLPAMPGVDEVSFWRNNDRIADPAMLLQGRTGVDRPSWLRRRARKLARRLGLRNEQSDWPRRPADELFHAPNFFLPPWADNGVVTVHDLSVLRHPETHPIERIVAFEREFASSIIRSRHIITPSHAVRDELLTFTGLAGKQVSVVAMGVSSRFRPIPVSERNPVLARLGLPTTGYGLSISALEPRKRIDCLIAAWRELSVPLRRRFPLVIGGASGWRNDSLHDDIARGAAEGWLIALGYLDEADLPALYSGAALFVYPSLYEGFGMPPIEAMACGVPAVVANASCMPEVSAGAAMLTEPADIAGFAAALERGLCDEDWRREAVQRGHAVAAGYSWQNCLTATIAIYSKVNQAN